jgi:hypothetical protein
MTRGEWCGEERCKLNKTAKTGTYLGEYQHDEQELVHNKNSIKNPTAIVVPR